MENQQVEGNNVFELVDDSSASTIANYLTNLQSQESGQEQLKKFLNQRNAKNQTVLHVICLQHHLDKTLILLEAGANPNVLDQDKQTPAFLVVLGLQNCSCEECIKKAVRCLTLLSYYGGNMEIPDAKKRTPLYLCTENRFIECAKTILLNGTALGKTPDDTPMIDILVERMPGVLETVFDCAVKREGSTNIDSLDCKLTFDLSVIVPYQTGHNTGEMKFLKSLLECSDRDPDCHNPTCRILRHPLVAVFMDIKWKALQRWYSCFIVWQFFILLAYTTLVCLTAFLNCSYGKYFDLQQINNTSNGSRHNTTETRIDQNATFEKDQYANTCNASTISKFFACLIILHTTAMLIHEIRRAMYDFKGYGRNPYHFLSIFGCFSVIFTAYIIIALDHTSSVYSFFYPISAFSILLSWCQVFVFTGRVPQLSIYVEMLVKISANFCKTMAIYSFLLVGFAISFCILFHPHPKLYNLTYSVTKLLSVLVGELDHEMLLNPANYHVDGDKASNSDEMASAEKDIEIEMFTGHRVMAYFWYVSVTIMITLVLMNLLVGLAVSDIQGIRENAEIYMIKRRIRYIAYLEKLLLEVFGKFLQKNLKSWSLKHIICPLELRDFTITICPNDKGFSEVSKECKQAIKHWVVYCSSTQQGVCSSILKKCKGTSPDSSSTLKKRRKSEYKRMSSSPGSSFVAGEYSQLILDQSSPQITDRDRLKRLERIVEQVNEKLDEILDGMG